MEPAVLIFWSIIAAIGYLGLVGFTAIITSTWPVDNKRWGLYAWVPPLALVMWLRVHRKED